MAKCPECKEEIHMMFFSGEIKVSVGGAYSAGEGFDYDNDLRDEMYDQSDSFEFRCPECDEVIARSIKDADEILEGDSK
jgi:phage FluMu protein Com